MTRCSGHSRSRTQLAPQSSHGLKWTTTTTDPNSNIKDYTVDAFGKLATVAEHIGSLKSTTTYTYDFLNNLATTTDGLGNVRHFTYDGLSRRLTAQDLHATGSALFGTSTYAYDNQSNLISETDPNGQVITRTYDALNRKLTESRQRFVRQSGNTHLRQLHKWHRVYVHRLFHVGTHKQLVRHSREPYVGDDDDKWYGVQHGLWV